LVRIDTGGLALSCKIVDSLINWEMLGFTIWSYMMSENFLVYSMHESSQNRISVYVCDSIYL